MNTYETAAEALHAIFTGEATPEEIDVEHEAYLRERGHLAADGTVTDRGLTFLADWEGSVNFCNASAT